MFITKPSLILTVSPIILYSDKYVLKFCLTVSDTVVRCLSLLNPNVCRLNVDGISPGRVTSFALVASTNVLATEP